MSKNNHLFLGKSQIWTNRGSTPSDIKAACPQRQFGSNNNYYLSGKSQIWTSYFLEYLAERQCLIMFALITRGSQVNQRCHSNPELAAAESCRRCKCCSFRSAGPRAIRRVASVDGRRWTEPSHTGNKPYLAGESGISSWFSLAIVKGHFPASYVGFPEGIGGR